jgi:hypothetical protein
VYLVCLGCLLLARCVGGGCRGELRSVVLAVVGRPWQGLWVRAAVKFVAGLGCLGS